MVLPMLTAHTLRVCRMSAAHQNAYYGILAARTPNPNEVLIPCAAVECSKPVTMPSLLSKPPSGAGIQAGAGAPADSATAVAAPAGGTLGPALRSPAAAAAGCRAAGRAMRHGAAA